MSEKVKRWLVQILVPVGAMALIIGALTAPKKTAVAFVLLLLMSYGVWSVFDPEGAFMFGQRWKFRRAEPSEMALLMTQLGGIILVVTCIVVLAILLFAQMNI
ncbi:MAG: hypothetical protein NZ610_07030 [Candidatus Bipolaricaulota bacterium]|nr:hypothetical protein [Candidatus Bipolaricaulota bacterium]MCS7275132.1 hypothetical protein [Candidatus Bipolaricaulota bacterium]MDW8110268.1 hypothetical protein [Candidatus Bipolaricaulota bacterium]MDW8328831.1 hypothetical protein [Candidatus Bipolaricaulota bacterium]